MRGLAAFIMKGRAQAVSAVCALTVLSWIFSLASLLSAAAMALPTLRLGAKEGVVVMAWAALGVSLAGFAVVGSPAPAGYSLALWAPIWLLAALLHGTARLSWSLAGAAGLGMAMVLAIYAISGDPAGMWAEELRRYAQPFLEKAGSEGGMERIGRNFQAFSRYMTGVVAAGSMLTLSLSLLIARWWQALLFNPGGFRAEFHSLRSASACAYLWLGLLALAWMLDGTGSEIAWNLAIPLAMLFVLAGFAVLHAVFSATGNGGFWLAGIYVALMFMSPLIGLILLIGLSDAWIDWRNRFRVAGTHSD